MLIHYSKFDCDFSRFDWFQIVYLAALFFSVEIRKQFGQVIFQPEKRKKTYTSFFTNNWFSMTYGFYRLVLINQLPAMQTLIQKQIEGQLSVFDFSSVHV